MDRRRNYTERFKRMIELARVEAHRAGQNAVTPEHLLAAMLHDRDSIAHKVVRSLVGDPRKLLDQTRNRPGREQDLRPEQIPLGKESEQIIQSAVETVSKTSRTPGEYVGTEHVLIEIIKDHESPAARHLTSLGVTLRNLSLAMEKFY